MSQKHGDLRMPGASNDDETGGNAPAAVAAPAGNVTLTAEQFAALMAQVNRAPAPSLAAANLPDIESLDLKSITKPVLTTTGWYVPEKFGSNPAQRSL